MIIVCWVLSLYLIVLVVRAIMSWFPIRSGTPWASIYGVVFDMTEPVLAPMRRVIPPAGMLDLSFLVLFFVLAILRTQIC